MKALILNSGIGSRMGVLTSNQPKCLTEIYGTETILGRQLKMLCEIGVSDVVITTGPFSDVIEQYVSSLSLQINVKYVYNPRYKETNYIYSIYCARDYLDDDIILMHGDLVFEYCVLDKTMQSVDSIMVVSSSVLPLAKDFKAVVESGYITYIGVDVINKAFAAQPLYKINKKDWKIWLDNIVLFCEDNRVNVYAENAFNEISNKCSIIPMDISDEFCMEVDTSEDLEVVCDRVKNLENRLVYVCFSTDVLHSGHIDLIKKAKRLGKLMIGVMTDEVVASYKRFPIVPCEERKTMFESISGVWKVVTQDTLSYKKNINQYRPDFVVHGDDWINGFQKQVRDEVISLLSEYGGKLIEYPYSNKLELKEIDKRVRSELSLPDVRRARLKKILETKKLVTVLEAHSGITGLIVENSMVYERGMAKQFDAMWVSSLCDSTAKGKPDIELVDMTSRYRTIDDIMEVTTKPVIFDGDTGGQTEHFVYTVRTLERMGVSMIIIEDKIGLKKNSLFGANVPQTQDTVEHFCMKILAGKRAQKSTDFMICARIESLIMQKGMEDALSRAYAYVKAGADAIMIHSVSSEPSEIFEFASRFRMSDRSTPLVVVPTTYSDVLEEELEKQGINIVIYANHLTRTGFPAMKNAAETILKNHRAKECDQMCMSINDIINLIPDEL